MITLVLKLTEGNSPNCSVNHYISGTLIHSGTTAKSLIASSIATVLGYENTYKAEKFVISGIMDSDSKHSSIGLVEQNINPSTLSPILGDRHLIGYNAEGEWKNKYDNVAEWNGTGWDYYDTKEVEVEIRVEIEVEEQERILQKYEYGGSNYYASKGRILEIDWVERENSTVFLTQGKGRYTDRIKYNSSILKKRGNHSP